jgi:hypothetical protein
MEDKVQPASNVDPDLGFSAWVELSELANKPNDDDIINISITAKDEDGTEVALSTVDPDSLECTDGFRNGRYYTISFDAMKANLANLTQDEIDDGAGALKIEAYVGKFDNKYTPRMDEGVQEFIEAAICGERKPNTTSAAIKEDRTEEVTRLLCRLAKSNQRDISLNPELGPVTKQLEQLARMIVGHNKTSDLSGFAALPGLLNKLCGPAAAE